MAVPGRRVLGPARPPAALAGDPPEATSPKGDHLQDIGDVKELTEILGATASPQPHRYPTVTAAHGPIQPHLLIGNSGFSHRLGRPHCNLTFPQLGGRVPPITSAVVALPMR